ncbi:MAG: hypothetical protein CVU97_04075 [Firmicutes bacterium HGW-Firmicutes-21]|nr:MAG: hypothetical protein CVU97_04075 [Firmicutes bacterium HGW-Firmicutes-21]
MKKFIAFIAICSIVLSLSFLSVSAETAKSLLPEDVSVWKSYDAGGETANAKLEGDATVIWGSTVSWPSVGYSMEVNDYITVSIEDTVIEYDFELDVGKTNISIFMKGDTPDKHDGKYISIIKFIESENIELESGDLYPGTYKGAFSISELVSHPDFPFETDNDETLTISGIRIFTVSGATVIINKLRIVEKSDAAPVSTDESIATISSDVSTTDSPDVSFNQSNDVSEKE